VHMCWKSTVLASPLHFSESPLLWELTFQLGTKQKKTWILMSYACLTCTVAKKEELQVTSVEFYGHFTQTVICWVTLNVLFLFVIILCLPKCGQMLLLWSLQCSRHNVRWRWFRRRRWNKEFTLEGNTTKDELHTT